jgi:predicted secreted protein
MKSFYRIFAMGALLCASGSASAATPATRLDLSASVQRELANDQLDATLYVEEQQASPSVLADRLNQDGARAGLLARGYPEVQVSSSAYSSWPQTDKNGKITGWQGRSEIHLRSMNFTQSAELVAQLQQFMLLGAVEFSISEANRKLQTQQMLPDAIRQLQDTARVAATALGKNHVRVATLSVGSNAGARPMMAMMATRAEPVSAPVALPDWQAGRSQLQLQVSGTLELY